MAGAPCVRRPLPGGATVGRVSTPLHLRLPPGVRAYRLDTARGTFAVHDAAPATPAGGTALLVPGFTGSKEDFLLVLRPLRAAGHRVLALDQRGQYETAGPATPGSYDLAELGLDLLAVAEAAGDGPVHLVGHSFGGLAVRAAALADPAAVRSVTLLCSGPGPIPEGEAERARTLIRALARHDVAEIWAHIRARAQANGEYDDVPPEIVEFMGRRFQASAHAGLAAMAGQLVDTPDRTADLAATGVPILVAYGEDDYIWPLAEQADMAARLGARHEVLAGAAHSPAVQKPDALAALLVDFWSAAERRHRADARAG